MADTKVGRVSQIIGAVVDVTFDDELAHVNARRLRSDSSLVERRPRSRRGRREPAMSYLRWLAAFANVDATLMREALDVSAARRLTRFEWVQNEFSLLARGDEERARHLDLHAKSMRNHVQTLGSKSYQSQFDDSPDYVVMFVPGEHFVAAALEQATFDGAPPAAECAQDLRAVDPYNGEDGTELDEDFECLALLGREEVQPFPDENEMSSGGNGNELRCSLDDTHDRRFYQFHHVHVRPALRLAAGSASPIPLRPVALHQG